MASVKQTGTRNRLLRAMSPDDFAVLQPHLVPAVTTLHQVMIVPHEAIERLFFPEVGFVSVVTDGTRTIEVGLIGREGLVGAAPLLLGDGRTPYRHVVQSPGEVLGIAIEDIRAATEHSRTLRRLLHRYLQTMLVQTTQTAFVNAVYTIEARLARWLLMCHDRLGVDELAVTHEYLGVMLGVQRTSVTLALQMLEGAGLIRARRGRVEVRDRARLKEAAEEGYGLPEAEYARLIEDKERVTPAE